MTLINTRLNNPLLPSSYNFQMSVLKGPISSLAEDFLTSLKDDTAIDCHEGLNTGFLQRQHSMGKRTLLYSAEESPILCLC